MRGDQQMIHADNAVLVRVNRHQVAILAQWAAHTDYLEAQVAEQYRPRKSQRRL